MIICVVPLLMNLPKKIVLRPITSIRSGNVSIRNFRIEKSSARERWNVYRAEQVSLGKAVAVKVLPHHLMADEKLVGRFKREAKSASKVDHPNSIQIIDSGQDKIGTLYIAMELFRRARSRPGDS